MYVVCSRDIFGVWSKIVPLCQSSGRVQSGIAGGSQEYEQFDALENVSRSLQWSVRNWNSAKCRHPFPIVPFYDPQNKLLLLCGSTLNYTERTASLMQHKLWSHPHPPQNKFLVLYPSTINSAHTSGFNLLTSLLTLRPPATPFVTPPKLCGIDSYQTPN